METSTESALWTALRILEERRNLLMKLGDKESARGSETVANLYSERASELILHIETLKNILFATYRDSL